jgi:hypothetical protein
VMRILLEKSVIAFQSPPPGSRQTKTRSGRGL